MVKEIEKIMLNLFIVLEKINLIFLNLFKVSYAI